MAARTTENHVDFLRPLTNLAHRTPVKLLITHHRKRQRTNAD
jgi:hypothetical protein